ncbi:MAG: 4'-phosphopantetheinyl transferase family protein [Mangrovibacterium sp.]
MPLEHHIEIGGGVLLTWSLTDDAEFKKWAIKYRYYPAFLRLNSTKRKKEWIAMQRLLHEVGLDSSKIYYNDQGKPFVNHVQYKYISISHSKNSVGIFLHPERNVGIDIETKTRNFKGIAHKYLSEHELEIAHRVPDGLAFFWCIKEAMFKVVGIPMPEFNPYNDVFISLVDEKVQASVDCRPNSFFELFRLEFGEQIILCVLEHV